MKKVLLAVLFLNPFALQLHAGAQPTISPDQLKNQLLLKYQGKINGIERLARATSDMVGLADASSIKQKIDMAVNQLRAMGTVNVSALEDDIEKAIHKSLMSTFNQSIDLASKTSHHEISDNLFAIAPWNKKIVWNENKTHVLMLTWIPAAYKETYEKCLKNKEEMKIAWDAWVTAVPEVKEFAQKYAEQDKNGFNLTDRIEQFLGLIPSKPPYATSQNKLFVEMWVRPEDIFRPCLDAEIFDTECVVDPHESDLDNLPQSFQNMSKMLSMTPQHKVWFEKEKKGKYEGQWAMPWTRFGYTYDWGSVKKIKGKLAAQGASEYLIKNGSMVRIHNIIPTDAYPNSITPKSGYIYKD